MSLKDLFGGTRKKEWDKVSGELAKLDHLMEVTCKKYCTFPGSFLLVDDDNISYEDVYIDLYHQFRKLWSYPTPGFAERDKVFAAHRCDRIEDRKKRGVQVFGIYDERYRRREEVGVK